MKRTLLTVSIGDRFGRLVVTQINTGKTKHGKWLHTCKCDCGAERTYIHGNLVRGLSQSCGCVGVERMKSGIAKTHGLSNGPEWLAHRNMLNRCYNPRNIGYPRYGGRGITVCERWRGPDGFKNFYADMGPRPEGPPKHSLGRIDNDGPYAPGNCRWETYVEQGRNQSSNRLITFRGVTKTMADWARHLGCTKAVLHRRIDWAGWDVGRALTTPVQPRAKRKAP